MQNKIIEEISSKKEAILYLYDIKEYIESTVYYLKTFDKNIDKGEIIMYLSCSPSIILGIINYLKESEML